MTIVLIGLFVLLAAIVVYGQRRQNLEAAQRAQLVADELAGVRRTTEEDITKFGEELRELELETLGVDIGDEGRKEYQQALEKYDQAKDAIGHVRRSEEIRHVLEILDDGRYAKACVVARARGEEMPKRRPPCFFNPQHGLSTDDVEWSPPGGARRTVPACAADAERVRRGADPESRIVIVGSQRVPYWQAGRAYSPYAAGMFGVGGAAAGLFVGSILGGVLADEWDDDLPELEPGSDD